MGVLKQRLKEQMSEYKLRIFSEFEINSAFGSGGQMIILVTE